MGAIDEASCLFFCVQSAAATEESGVLYRVLQGRSPSASRPPTQNWHRDVRFLFFVLTLTNPNPKFGVLVSSSCFCFSFAVSAPRAPQLVLRGAPEAAMMIPALASKRKRFEVPSGLVCDARSSRIGAELESIYWIQSKSAATAWDGAWSLLSLSFPHLGERKR